jgi:hypothetical protein
VAFSSTVPENLRLAATALGSGFDLLTLRARCKREPMTPAPAVQGACRRNFANCAKLRRRPPLGTRRSRDEVGRSGRKVRCAAAGQLSRTKKNSASRWRFRPPSPRTFALRLLPSGAASTYSRSVLAARSNLPTARANARGRRNGNAQFAKSSARSGLRSLSCRALYRSGPEFSEPVALSSTVPANLRLPPRALGSGFDLLALRARCKREPTRPGARPQAPAAAKVAQFAGTRSSTYPQLPPGAVEN